MKSRTGCKRKRRKHLNSSSDESDCSHMSSFFSTNFEGSEDEQKNKIKGFHVTSYEDVSKYDLQEDVASYVNEYISHFISEKEFKKSILIIPQC